MPEPTEGEWIVTKNYNGHTVVTSKTHGYVPIRTPFRENALTPEHPDVAKLISMEEVEANMHLIAASKNLLACCEAELATYPVTDKGYTKHGLARRDALRKAIAKAKGNENA